MDRERGWGEREDMKVEMKLWRTKGTSGKRMRVKGRGYLVGDVV